MLRLRPDSKATDHVARVAAGVLPMRLLHTHTPYLWLRWSEAAMHQHVYVYRHPAAGLSVQLWNPPTAKRWMMGVIGYTGIQLGPSRDS